MDKKKSVLLAEPGSDDKIGFGLFAGGNVRKDFLVEKLKGVGSEILGDFGQESLDKVGEKDS